MRIGAAALLAMLLPVGLYITYCVSTWQEEALVDRGTILANSLLREIVDPMLIGDRLAVHDVFVKAANADKKLRYLYAEDARGDIVAHTFSGGFPVALRDFLREGNRQVVRFRTNAGAMVDISTAILTPELGTLHVGLSRTQVISARRRMMCLLGLTFAGGLTVLLAGARLVAAKVSSPLQRLEQQVSRLPESPPTGDIRAVSGTREVESLARGFSEMADRLETLERERAATQERMIHAEHLAVLGQVSAGLAHEIRNPLNGLLQCLRYLGETANQSDEAAKYYPMMEEEVGRIARAMKQMLTFAHSGQNMSIEPCGIADTMASLKLLVQSHVEGRKVRLTWRNPGNCMGLCDPQGLSQAVLNLVLNAVDAAEGGADPQVLVEADCDSQWAYIYIEDSGPGVPDDLRARVFEPFFTTKPTCEGTGLGLSVSRQLMRSIGGDVELSAEEGVFGGARFMIRIPKVPSQERPHGQKTCQNPDRR